MQVLEFEAAPASVDPPRSYFSTSDAGPENLISRLLSAWEKITASDLSLYVLLLAVNSIALPYAGIVHDARLYGIQVLNRIENGAYANDLYLKYGSQDKFSAFSLIAAPLVSTLGLQLAFFVIYLISNAVFTFGLLRLVVALVEDRKLASLALVFMVTTLVPFAGLENFYVNENLVTSRLAATGLVLLALERLLNRHLKTSAALLLAALLLHPLMAFAGLLVAIVFWLAVRLSCFQLASLGLVLAGLVCSFLLTEPLADKLLGRMDAEWREAVRIANPYNFPSEWAAQDWLQILAALGIAAAATAGPVQDRRLQRFVWILSIVAMLGITASVVAPLLPYALPLQGQGYRWLWILQYLQVPLGFALIVNWWQQGSNLTRLAALVLLAYLGALTRDRTSFLLLLPVVAAFGLWAANEARRSTGPFLVALCLSQVVFLLVHQGKALHSYWIQVGDGLDAIEFIRTAPNALLPLTRLMICMGAALALGWLVRSRRAFLAVAGSACLILQIGYFSSSQAAQAHHPTSPTRLVKDYLYSHYPETRENVTIYWPIGWINHIWLDLHANSYFEAMQIAGNIFNRDTAMEGQRRAQLVRRFEMDRIKAIAHLYSPLQLRALERQFQASLMEPGPGFEDLQGLIAEPGLDLVLLRQRFDGLYSATDGDWFLYDCRAIRHGPLSAPASFPVRDRKDLP